MLLTLSQPSRVDFGRRFTHDFAPRFSLPKPRVSPLPPPSQIESQVKSLRVSVSTAEPPVDPKMSTPHRGLPPPSAMTLPDPIRPQQQQQPPPQPPPPPASSLGQQLGPMPAPPLQWHGQEESMRNWLMAKAEEDRRKQEEEKTRQESYRLEQRKIEQSMLRESLQAGVPPTLIPLIYAGIGGANLANISLEGLQHYAAQLQTAQQPPPPPSLPPPQPSPPELRRESRLISQAPAYGVQSSSGQMLPSQPSERTPPHALQTTFSAYQPIGPRVPPASMPRSATHTQLPRLATSEIYGQPAPPPIASGPAQPVHPSQPTDPQASSPSIYFHHWVPPNDSRTNQPQTPGSKGEPGSARPGSQLSEGDFRGSPKKRKAAGPHAAVPAPPPAHTSPSFSAASSSSGRRGAHHRTRSSICGRDGDTSYSSRPTSGREREPMSSFRAGPVESSRVSDFSRPRASSAFSESRSDRPPARQESKREDD